MRDFYEEYEKYINEETPDLWNRIEPQLKDKNVDESFEETIQKEVVIETKDNRDSKKSAKIIPLYIKRAMPVAAAVCVLSIFVGIYQINQSASKSEETACSESIAADATFDESAVVTDEAPAYEESAAASSEADYSEAYDEMEDAGAVMESTDEAANYDEKDEGVSNSADAIKETSNTCAPASIFTDDQFAMSSIVVLNDMKLVEVHKTDAEMEEKGYVYEYCFVTKDGAELIAYLDEKNFRELEDSETDVKRQEIYEIGVIPYLQDQKESSEEGKNYCILKEIQKN